MASAHDGSQSPGDTYDGSEDSSSIVKIDDEDLNPDLGDRRGLEMRSLDPFEVTFKDVSDAYILGQDIPCCYTLGSGVQVKSGDRVAIFRVPWSSINDYFAFVWAKETVNDMKKSGLATSFSQLCARETRKVFTAADLATIPADDDEYYQFCYVSEDGEIAGTSSTFQIFSENKEATHTERTSLEEVCKHCPTLKAKIQELEKTIEEKSSIESFAPLNEAMAVDLQSARERIRELTDQESALKEKLRSIFDELTNIDLALAELDGNTSGTASDKVIRLQRKLEGFEHDRRVLKLLSTFVAQVQLTGKMEVAESQEFEELQSNEIADFIVTKAKEVEMLKSIVEKKEAELVEVKNELRVERANTDELMKAMTDEMDAKNRVLQGTIRDLQDQAKKNLEVIASVGMINHTRREGVQTYLRELAKDPKYSTVVTEIGSTIMTILESSESGRSFINSFRKLVPDEEVKETGGSNQEAGAIATPLTVDVEPEGDAEASGNWDTMSSVTEKCSVSSQTSPLGAAKASKASSTSGQSMTASAVMVDEAMVDRIIPVVTEQVGTLLKSAIQSVLTESTTGSIVEEPAQHQAEQHQDEVDMSDYESVASQDLGDETPVASVPKPIRSEPEDVHPEATSETGGEAAATEATPEAEIEPETQVERPESQADEEPIRPPIPEMMRRFSDQPQHGSEAPAIEQQEMPTAASRTEPPSAPAFDANRPFQYPRGPVMVMPIHPNVPLQRPEIPGVRGPPCAVRPIFNVPPFVPPGQFSFGRPLYSRDSHPPTTDSTGNFSRSGESLFAPRVNPVRPPGFDFGGDFNRPAPSFGDLPPPLLPQPAPRTIHEGSNSGPPPDAFQAELDSARRAALDAAARGTEAASRSGSAASASAAAAANAAADSAIRTANAAAAVGLEAAERGFNRAADLTRRIIENASMTSEEREAFRAQNFMECPICNKSFEANQEAELNNHIDVEHLEFQCPICSESFPRAVEEIFVNHVNTCVDRIPDGDGYTRGFRHQFGSSTPTFDFD